MRTTLFRSTSWFLLAGAANAISCNKASFSSQDQKAEPQNHTVVIDGIESTDTVAEKRVRNFDNVDFHITTKAARVDNSFETVMYPVDLYFVVDRTASMEGELTEVKRGLVEIANQLKQRGVDLQAGFLGFVDDPEVAAQNPLAPLTGDMAELSRYISTVATMGNSDYPEGSLAAVSKVIDRFKSGEGRPDAAKMVLLVTDVVGHNGGPIGTTANVNRDCSLSSLVQKINDYAASLGDPARFKFFYVVPDPQYLDENATGDRQNATTTCPTAPGAVTIFNAKVQMETLINQIVTAVPKEKRGGALLDTSGRHAWPLKDNNLVTSLIPMIASAKPQQKSLSCLATKFGAFEGNRPIYNWEADSVASILNDPNPVLKMDDVLRQEQNRTLGNQLIQLRINRCCVDTGALLPTIGGSASPSPSPAKPLSCEKEYIQTVNYRIINE